MNIFLFELWNDSTKTIRLLALDFHAVIVDSGFALINYHLIEISSSQSKAPSTRTRVNLKPGKYFHGYAYRPHVTG